MWQTKRMSDWYRTFLSHSITPCVSNKAANYNEAIYFTVCLTCFKRLHYLELQGSALVWWDSRPFGPSLWSAGLQSGTATGWITGPKAAARTPSSSCDPMFPENSHSAEGKKKERFNKGTNLFSYNLELLREWQWTDHWNHQSGAQSRKMSETL